MSYEEAERAFFAVHAEDPRVVERYGETAPWSVVYHERMKVWLASLVPDASEELRLAACCQHIRRWRIPRGSYPAGKLGYKTWRRDLASFHGDEAEALLREVG